MKKRKKYKKSFVYKKKVYELSSHGHRVDRIKHGFHIPILEETRGCHNCPISDGCELSETFTAEQKRNGCNAVTQTYLNIVKEFDDLPTMLAKDLISLRTEIRLKEVLDRKKGTLLDEKRLRAVKMANEMTRNLAKVMELKERREERKMKNVPTIDLDKKVEL